MREGFGIQTWPDGKKYEGRWRQDMRHDEKGAQTYPNGMRYEGNFADDKKQGAATVTWTNGSKFIGNFVDG